MRRVIAPISLRAYLIALAFVTAATLGLIVLQSELPHWFNLPIVVITFLLAINIATQAVGFGPGVAAAVASFLCLNFFFIDPRGTLLVSNVTDLILLALFLVVALVNSELLGRAQRRAIEAAQRERDATHFYEFSLALISARDATEIANTLASRLHAILGTPAVQVTLQPSAAGQPEAVVAAGRVPNDVPPSHVEPIASARANFGEIRLWRYATPLTLGEERMMGTFSGEAAVLLERMRMADVETRTRVLEQSDRLKTALLDSVSHELRTPLATIRAGTETLRSGLVSPESDAGRETLDDVSDAVERLTRLVGNMLDMTKIESGALKPAREWCDLAEVADAAAARLRDDPGRHALTITMPDNLPLTPADPVQLDQVFTNLISNSIKYAPPETRVSITARVLGADEVLIEVSNESPNLPPEDLERIFDKFYRVTDADRVVGTGLGLSICKGIIEAHGGRIWAANRAGADRGLIFKFALPLTWDGAAPKLPPPELPEAVGATHPARVSP
jgi:two-component system sensor histidine kinase KdpD